MVGGSLKSERLFFECLIRAVCVSFEETNLRGSMHTRVMGIVNITPDSFYDGGRHSAVEEAVAHGLRLADEGAAVLDIGGESTRPGAEGVSAEKELARVLPVIEQLASNTRVPISIDTTKAEVARQALQAGASWINDISAGLLDPDIIPVAAETGAFYVAMHMRGTPRTMVTDTDYNNLIGEINDHLAERVAMCEAAGIERARIVLDPGIGFAKTRAQNYEILAKLEAFRTHGLPLLVGPSRKRFLSLAGADEVTDRLPGTLAAVCLCALANIEWVRVHDVAEAVQAINVIERTQREAMR